MSTFEEVMNGLARRTPSAWVFPLRLWIFGLNFPLTLPIVVTPTAALSSISIAPEMPLTGSAYTSPATAANKTGAIPKSPRSTNSNSLPLSATHYSSASIKDGINPTTSASQLKNCPPSEGQAPYAASDALRTSGVYPTITALAPPHASCVSSTPATAEPQALLTPIELRLATETAVRIKASVLPHADEILAYIRSKTNSTLSPLSCVKLTKDGSPDRVIASFKVTYPHNFDAIVQSS